MKRERSISLPFFRFHALISLKTRCTPLCRDQAYDSETFQPVEKSWAKKLHKNKEKFCPAHVIDLNCLQVVAVKPKTKLGGRLQGIEFACFSWIDLGPRFRARHIGSGEEIYRFFIQNIPW
jgi:hypothetical protein